MWSETACKGDLGDLCNVCKNPADQSDISTKQSDIEEPLTTLKVIYLQMYQM